MLGWFISKIEDKILSYIWKATLVRATLGKKIFISKNAFISNSFINDYSSIGRNSTVINSNLGKYCSISWNVTIGATQHPFEKISTHAFSYIKRFGFVKYNKRFIKHTLIENDVWIGANAIVMPGITVGNGAVIGAGSVVTKDVPAYAIVAGVPAKIIRYRFSKEIILKFLELGWWDINPDIIKENIELWKEDVDLNSLEKLEKVCK